MTRRWVALSAVAALVVALLVGGAACAETPEPVQTRTEAARAVDAEAQYELGKMLERRDAVSAVEWYRKAAEQGHAEAQYNLGLMYTYGDGVVQDAVEAVAWFRKAAEQGHAQAQRRLRYATLRVAVWDDGLAEGSIALIDLEAEIVLRNEQNGTLFGGWTIGRAVREERGASIRDFGPLEIDKKYAVLFTHARRDGSTVEIPIELTSAICIHGCDRDTLHIDVFSENIELWGTPIHATGNKELEVRR